MTTYIGLSAKTQKRKISTGKLLVPAGKIGKSKVPQQSCVLVVQVLVFIVVVFYHARWWLFIWHAYA
jgi:hypothetical protein